MRIGFSLHNSQGIEDAQALVETTSSTRARARAHRRPALLRAAHAARLRGGADLAGTSRHLRARAAVPQPDSPGQGRHHPRRAEWRPAGPGDRPRGDRAGDGGLACAGGRRGGESGGGERGWGCSVCRERRFRQPGRLSRLRS
jgi:hypothetical protein